MKISKWLPILLMVALLKVSVSGFYLFYARNGKFALGLEEAKAAPPKETPKKELPPKCPEALFQALKAEREKIAKERRELEKKKRDLALLEEQVTRRLATLKTLEEELDKKLTELRTIKNKRFKLLVGAYGNMKPSKAAKLIEAMEPEMAIKILSALKTEQVARILSAMPPDKAASLAEALSGLPPREM